MDLVQVSFDKIMQTNAYTVIIFAADSKKIAIYTEPNVGKAIQKYFTGEKQKRPSTFDLIGRVFQGLEVRIKQVVISDVEDTVYFARLFLEQQVGEERSIVEVDARPSDCITLALMHNIPIYCRKEVLEKTLSIDG